MTSPLHSAECSSLAKAPAVIHSPRRGRSLVTERVWSAILRRWQPRGRVSTRGASALSPQRHALTYPARSLSVDGCLSRLASHTGGELILDAENDVGLAVARWQAEPSGREPLPHVREPRSWRRTSR